MSIPTRAGTVRTQDVYKYISTKLRFPQIIVYHVSIRLSLSFHTSNSIARFRFTLFINSPNLLNLLNFSNKLQYKNYVELAALIYVVYHYSRAKRSSAEGGKYYDKWYYDKWYTTYINCSLYRVFILCVVYSMYYVSTD